MVVNQLLGSDYYLPIPTMVQTSVLIGSIDSICCQRVMDSDLNWETVFLTL